ncbi:hypothetical protein ACIPF8_07820 [Collimonas sp. NPDC087041]|uniref:hypothetical protein n=1 Tax=Collimonas sp. NPDC087041 TaxID=3363960 RepID=UPI003826409A
MLRKRICFLLLALPLSACAYKPFQPNPPMFQTYFKAGVDEEGVKVAMRQCGYSSVVGRVAGDTVNDIAKRQNCMFANGFKFRDGSKGICSWANDKESIPACQADR